VLKKDYRYEARRTVRALTDVDVDLPLVTGYEQERTTTFAFVPDDLEFAQPRIYGAEKKVAQLDVHVWQNTVYWRSRCRILASLQQSAEIVFHDPCNRLRATGIFSYC